MWRLWRCVSQEGDLVDTEIRHTIEKMIRLYAAMRPDYLNHPDLAWEMTKETIEAFATEFRTSFPTTWEGAIDFKVGDNLTFLGIRVVVVERPGIRLVFEVVE